MELKYYIILGVILALVVLLNERNKKTSKNIEYRKAVREKSRIMLRKFKNSSNINHPISRSLVKLIENYHVHFNVGETLTDKEIIEIEKRLNLRLPESYKIFLKYFGDGGDWVFYQNIDNIQNYAYLNKYIHDLGETIQLNNQSIKVNSLLCLMTEDSNGGAWCWLTSKEKKEKEWSLAYYSMSDKKLHYKVRNFTEWLNILAEKKVKL